MRLFEFPVCIFMLLVMKHVDCEYEITNTPWIRKAARFQPTTSASMFGSNEHRKYFKIDKGTHQDDPMVFKNCACSFKELKNEAILRKFIRIGFSQSQSRYFVKYIL